MSRPHESPETPEEFAARMRDIVNAPLVSHHRPKRSRPGRWLLGVRHRVLSATVARGIQVAAAEVTLDHFAGERLAYEPCDALVARRALRLIPADCRDTLVEVGCGMGFVACLAARMDFGTIVAVDIGASLTDRARENADRERLRPRSAPIDVVTADAVLWQIPDTATAAFLFCPFAGEAFATWLERVRETLQRQPRPFAVAYVFPIEAPQLVASGLFREVERRRGGRIDDPAGRIVVYRHDP